MATLRELFVKVGVKVNDKQLQQLDKGIQQVKKSALLLGGAIAGISAAMFAATKSAADYADKIDDTSMRLGIARDELQKLSYAAQLSGGNFDLLTIGMTRLTDRMRLVEQGSKEATKTYEDLGISIRNQEGNLKNSNEILLELADVFSELPDGAEKTKLAMQAIGPEAGPKLIPLLNAGRKGIEAMGKEAEELGLILDDTSIKAGSDFNDALDSMLSTFSGIKNAIGAQLFPVFTELLNNFKQLVIANKEVINSGIKSFVSGLITLIQVLNSSFSVVVNTISYLTSVIGGLIPVLKTLGALFLLYQTGQLAMGIYNIAKGFMVLRKAITLANISAMAIPILIGLAVAAVFLIIDDLFAFIQGKPSFLGYLIANKDKILQSIEDFLANVLSSILEFFGVSEENTETFIDYLRKAFDFLTTTVGESFTWLGTMIADTLEVIYNLINGDFTEAFESFKNLLGTLFQPWVSAWEVASDLIMKGIDKLSNFVSESFIGKLAGKAIDFTGNITEKITSVFSNDNDITNDTPRLFGDVASSLAQSPSMNQSTVSNRSVASSTTVAPVINISMGAGASSNPNDLAEAIGRELTRVSQNVAKNNEPIFAD